MRLIEDLMLIWVLVVGSALISINEMLGLKTYIAILWMLVTILLLLIYIILCVYRALKSIKTWIINKINK